MSDKEIIELSAAITQAEEMPNKNSAPTLNPINANQRINALDILRGFALIGILLMNIEWFGRPISDIGSFSKDLLGLDHAVGWLVRCFVEGKFYKLFALLFGMGFAVMLTQAMQKERPFGAWFTRRMLVLFVLGILHMFFLWQGDILHDYAFAGMVMLGLIYLLRRPRLAKFNNPTSILKLALWWLTIPMLLACFAGAGFSVFNDRASLAESWQKNQEVTQLVAELEINAEQQADTSAEDLVAEDGAESIIDAASTLTEEVSTIPSDELLEQSETVTAEDSSAEMLESKEDVELTPQEQAQERFDARQERKQKGEEEITALKEGSYWEATLFRIKASGMWLAMMPMFALTMLVPIFLLGYWLVVTGAIKHHTEHAKLFSYMARIGLGVGFFTTVGGLLITGHPAAENVMIFQGVGSVLFNGGQFFMAAGYLGLLVRLLDRARWYRILAKLASMGRMALTNYIMHSVILTSIFYGYAGGLYGEVARAPQMLIVLAIIAIQIPLSSWWLKNYQFGPLEWLWRSLTYKKWQSFKVVSST
jgi:uncharacterized membrane protein YeiB